jgi:hypothetical protein
MRQFHTVRFLLLFFMIGWYYKANDCLAILEFGTGLIGRLLLQP